MLNASWQRKSADGSLTPHAALRMAWVAWLGMLVLPFFLFLFTVWDLSGAESASRESSKAGMVWFIVGAIYLIIVVPFSFFWRAHVFKAYWSGTPVNPHQYLIGMVSVWVALEIGGIFSLIGCLVTQSLLPCLLPALIAFMFFVTLWPSGRSMTRTVGQAEDPAVYEEPR